MKTGHIAASLMIALFIILGIANPQNFWDAFFTGLLTVYIVFMTLIIKLPIRFVNLIIVPLLIIFTFTSLTNSGKVKHFLETEQRNKTYRTDMDDYLKTYYLMKQGNSYYTSYLLAVEQNPFKGVISDNLWAWRLPTVFYIWLMLPAKDGRVIFYLFLSLSLFLMLLD